MRKGDGEGLLFGGGSKIIMLLSSTSVMITYCIWKKSLSEKHSVP